MTQEELNKLQGKALQQLKSGESLFGSNCAGLGIDRMAG